MTHCLPLVPHRRNIVGCERSAERPELLIPIRLNIEHNGYRLKDTFLWNANEAVVAVRCTIETGFFLLNDNARFFAR